MRRNSRQIVRRKSSPDEGCEIREDFSGFHVENFKFTHGHARPILCGAIHSRSMQAVTGSSDHGLRLWDLRERKFLRELYTKTDGHSEWVTSCAFSPDGSVVSGGMDGYLCIWEKERPRCTALTGHTKSISKVAVDSTYTGITSGYDGLVCLWDCARKQAIGEFKGHSSPVTTFVWRQSLLVSGDKQGSLIFWDVQTQTALHYIPNCHEGLISGGTILAEEGNATKRVDRAAKVLTFGAYDGQVVGHDLRCLGKPLFRRQLHSGSINFHSFLPKESGWKHTNPRYLVTGGSDGLVKVWRISNIHRTSYESFFKVPCISLLTVKNAPVISGVAVNPSAFAVGASDGTLLWKTFDPGELDSSHLKVEEDTAWSWGLAVDQKAGPINTINSIPTGNKKESVLFAGGEDGEPILVDVSVAVHWPDER